MEFSEFPLSHFTLLLLGKKSGYVTISIYKHMSALMPPSPISAPVKNVG